jgi:hypothetical protein
MAADIKGTAVVWGMGGITFTAGITAASMPQSLSYQRGSELAEIKDTHGAIKTMVFHGGMKTVSISVVPSGANIAAAVTAKESYIPLPGTKVTIADASQDNPPGENQIEQNWIVVSATEGRTVDGVVTIDLELENADTDISTSAA